MTNGIKSIVLAALAASVLLVQPICDAHEADAGGPAPCSASIADAALENVVAALAPLVKPPAVPMAEAFSSVWRAAQPDTASAAPPHHRLASLRYHARSARILS